MPCLSTGHSNAVIYQLIAPESLANLICKSSGKHVR